MKKNTLEKSLNWDAHYVGIKAMREQKQNCIIYGEVISLALKHLSFRFAPTITEDQIPQFTAWGASDLKGNMAYLKNNYLSKPWN
jgi:hypothetical protein